jgi:hypothetical protein
MGFEIAVTDVASSELWTKLQRDIRTSSLMLVSEVTHFQSAFDRLLDGLQNFEGECDLELDATADGLERLWNNLIDIFARFLDATNWIPSNSALQSVENDRASKGLGVRESVRAEVAKFMRTERPPYVEMRPVVASRARRSSKGSPLKSLRLRVKALRQNLLVQVPAVQQIFDGALRNYAQATSQLTKLSLQFSRDP